MNKLWKFINERFSTKPKNYAYKPLIHEPYKVDFEEETYINWKASQNIIKLKTTIYDAYIDALTQSSNDDISFSMQSTFSGMRILPHGDIQKKSTFLLLQKYITEATVALGYFIQMSEIRTREIDGQLQTIYNIYI